MYKRQPFTLSASGDEIALFEWDEASEIWILLDFFAFGTSEQDASLGRYPDGADYWVWFATPTADATNNYAIILGDDGAPEPAGRSFGPNPSADHIRWGGPPAAGTLHDAKGSLRLAFSRARGLGRGNLESGAYILTLEDGSRCRWIIVD